MAGCSHTEQGQDPFPRESFPLVSSQHLQPIRQDPNTPHLTVIGSQGAARVHRQEPGQVSPASAQGKHLGKGGSTISQGLFSFLVDFDSSGILAEGMGWENIINLGPAELSVPREREAISPNFPGEPVLPLGAIHFFLLQAHQFLQERCVRVCVRHLKA